MTRDLCFGPAMLDQQQQQQQQQGLFELQDALKVYWNHTQKPSTNVTITAE